MNLYVYISNVNTYFETRTYHPAFRATDIALAIHKCVQGLFTLFYITFAHSICASLRVIINEVLYVDLCVG